MNLKRTGAFLSLGVSKSLRFVFLNVTQNFECGARKHAFWNLYLRTPQANKVRVQFHAINTLCDFIHQFQLNSTQQSSSHTTFCDQQHEGTSLICGKCMVISSETWKVVRVQNPNSGGSWTDFIHEFHVLRTQGARNLQLTQQNSSHTYFLWPIARRSFLHV